MSAAFEHDRRPPTHCQFHLGAAAPLAGPPSPRKTNRADTTLFSRVPGSGSSSGPSVLNHASTTFLTSSARWKMRKQCALKKWIDHKRLGAPLLCANHPCFLRRLLCIRTWHPGPAPATVFSNFYGATGTSSTSNGTRESREKKIECHPRVAHCEETRVVRQMRTPCIAPDAQRSNGNMSCWTCWARKMRSSAQTVVDRVTRPTARRLKSNAHLAAHLAGRGRAQEEITQQRLQRSDRDDCEIIAAETELFAECSGSFPRQRKLDRYGSDVTK